MNKQKIKRMEYKYLFKCACGEENIIMDLFIPKVYIRLSIESANPSGSSTLSFKCKKCKKVSFLILREIK